MASSKDTFEAKTFATNTFACGTFRGLGADTIGPSATIEDLVKYGFEQQEVCNYGFTATEVIDYG